jgi:predicted flap endonuclease-1-like 5' DNA nuclease
MFDACLLRHTQRMEAFTAQLALYLAVAAFVGAGIGFLLRGPSNARLNDELDREWQDKLDDLIRQRDKLVLETAILRSNIEDQEAVVRRHETAIAQGRTALDSALEKEKLMARDLFNLRAEREGFKTKMLTFQNALIAMKQQSAELQEEFIKSGNVYKRELAKAFEKRKALEMKIANASMEHESFSNLLQASRSEQESVNRMLDSARARLAEQDKLEQQVIGLEADNAELRQDLLLAQQEIETLRRDVLELDELKVQNKELAHCLKSMEKSRRQHEEDAKRYREHAGQYEKHSETLRMQLDEVEKHFADLQVQQRAALTEARNATTAKAKNGKSLNGRADKEPATTMEQDDLKAIIGIGKVFEHTLNSLGIYTFEQIANFTTADIARVNAELKEFKGRMEQDDWIGQAKELHYKKYAAAEEA